MKKNYKKLVEEFNIHQDITLDVFIKDINTILKKGEELKSLGVDFKTETVVSFRFNYGYDLLVSLESEVPMTKEELSEIQKNKKQMRQATKDRKMREYLKLKKELGM
jgi:hypothetical protein